MRKDEIEERITRIEKSIKEIQAGQRETSDTIRNEIRSFQSLVIEEKVETMRQQIVRGYQQLLLDLVLTGVQKEFERAFTDPCPRTDRSECIGFFLARLKEIGERMDPDEAEQFMTAQKIQDEGLYVQYPELKDEPCKNCYATYLQERDSLMHQIGELCSSRRMLQRKKHDVQVAGMPDEHVLSSIIEPLSHPVRFAMLKALFGGSMSYTELSSLTGHKGGHLLFHITRLTEAGLAEKSESTGLYTLTEKGTGTMTFIRDLYCS
ncbi:hypothetical protein Mpal_1482 [Methanosphaerula palustris E1-9c]|uniref:HTH arsR-type domain-containing protein n=2 Tax=Methanosphaerula palustris TaxID=475088 RepID=B8GIJ0_METPE|nr:hypothetical protein Mpal_1482 [Methanosphaerula palustris E1-9c]